MLRIVGALACAGVFAASVLAAPLSAAECSGDLDQDGEVLIHEILSIVSCVLDSRGTTCIGQMDVADVTAAVNDALSGCVESRWVTIFCRQCQACAFDALSPPIPESVNVLEQRMDPARVSCQACGVCPDGPIHFARVAEPDVALMRIFGWSLAGLRD